MSTPRPTTGEPFRFGKGGWAAESHRPPCRRTPLHLAVYNRQFEVVAELLVYGADLALQDRDGYHCAAPHSRPTAQPRARRVTPKRLAERRGQLAEYEEAERQVPFACVGF